MNEFDLKRKTLIENLSSTQTIISPEIKKAFLSVKRELFLSENMKQLAYEDNAFPLAFGQTISQPTTIATMLELLQTKEGQSVLEIGSGSGYVLALLSSIIGKKGKVIGTELLKQLAKQSKMSLKSQEIKNFEVLNEDGIEFAKEKKFDRILVSCSCPFLPKPLFDSLNEKGITVAPVGDLHTQRLLQMTKFKNKPVKKFAEGFYSFVPLKGKFGFT